MILRRPVFYGRVALNDQVNAMAKRTTRTKTPGTPATSKTPNDSVTYSSGSADVPDQASDLGGPDEKTRNDSMGSEPSEEEIRIRAYRRYLERGGSDGQDFDDWLQAERELKIVGKS
jgi:hypothetical protein